MSVCGKCGIRPIAAGQGEDQYMTDKHVFDLRGITAIETARKQTEELWKEAYGTACDSAREDMAYQRDTPTDAKVDRHAELLFRNAVTRVLSLIYDDRLIELLAAGVHEAWMEQCRANGLTTRISSVTGEEQMRPYADLSEPVKEYDRVTVRAVVEGLRGVVRAGRLPAPATSGTAAAQEAEETP